MRLGMFSMPSHPPERGLGEGHDWDLQTLIWADELGFEEAWIGEHHAMVWEPHPSPDLLVVEGFRHTKNLRIGPGGFLLPYYHPAELANRVSMMDHLSEGRLNFGVAASGLPSDWAMFGVDGMEGLFPEGRCLLVRQKLFPGQRIRSLHRCDRPKVPHSAKIRITPGGLGRFGLSERDKRRKRNCGGHKEWSEAL